MSNIVSAQQMRDIEKAAVESGAVSGLQLMERAGQAVVDALLSAMPQATDGPQSAIVLCGPGNNGGDGFVVARLLLGLGWRVTVFFYGEPTKMPADARANFERWTELAPAQTERIEFPVASTDCATAFSKAAFSGAGTDVIVDALFGIGLNRALTGLQPILAVCHVNRDASFFVAVDVPSGLGEAGPLDADRELVFPADLTVTFHRLKKAHYHGRELCGKIAVQDIGL